MDSFQIGIPVKNFGAYNKENFYVLVKRNVNGIETVFKEVKYPPVKYLDTLYFTIKGNTSNQYGLTNFYIKVDSRDTVQEMKEDIKELLKLFYEKNRVKPMHIVVYRDGVSMGEFAGVMVKVRSASVSAEISVRSP